MKKKSLAGVLIGLFIFGMLGIANAMPITVSGPAAINVDTDPATVVTLV